MSDLPSLSLTDLRTVHSRARTAWEELDDRRQDNAMGFNAFADRERGYWRDWSTRSGRPVTVPTDDEIRAKFPRWNDEDQKALDDLDAVVRLLDKYALPKKQVYGGKA